MKYNIELSEEDAKLLLILTGSTAVSDINSNLYYRLHTITEAFGDIPDPDLSNGYSIVVRQEMLDKVKLGTN
jgi:hypothetical protein